MKSTDPVSEALAVSLFSEILTVEHLARQAVARVLPKGMELSQFTVLNHLANLGTERSPAQLARSFHLTKGAMTNTLGRLERAGYIHVRPDWNDARKKLVSISDAGRQARDAALAAITPVIQDSVDGVGPDRVRTALPVLRALRQRLGEVR